MYKKTTKKKSQTDVSIFFQKSWLFIKTNWRYAAVVLGALVAYLLLNKQKSSLLDQLQEIRASYESQISKIEAARREEREKNAQELKILKKRLEDVQKQYDDAKKDLDDKKRAEIEELIKKYSDNPEELAKKLSEATGFKIILPE